MAARRLVAAGAALALALSSCSSGGGGGPSLHGTVTVGVLAPLSGQLAPLGRDLVNGARLAADEADDAGGVLGHHVHVAVEDGGCAARIASAAATRLVDRAVVGVVGGACDDAAGAAADALAAGGKPMLVSSADADSLVARDRPLTFLVTGSVYQQGMAAAHWIAYRRTQRLALVAGSAARSRELTDVIARDVDTDVVGRQRVGDGRSLGRAATSTLRAHPDLVYWAGPAQAGGQLLQELRGSGYRGSFLASAESDSPEFLAAAGTRAAQGAFVTTPARPGLLPATAHWAERYRARFLRDPGRAAMQAYDAMRALLSAVRQAGTTRGSDVARSLMALRGFSTFMGELQFAADHSMVYDDYVIAVVRDGTFTLGSKLRTD